TTSGNSGLAAPAPESSLAKVQRSIPKSAVNVFFLLMATAFGAATAAAMATATQGRRHEKRCDRMGILLGDDDPRSRSFRLEPSRSENPSNLPAPARDGNSGRDRSLRRQPGRIECPS